jgi:hypothetical protein
VATLTREAYLQSCKGSVKAKAIWQTFIVLMTFSLVFKLCGNIDLLGIPARMQGKCESYNNLANFNCTNEQINKCKCWACFQQQMINKVDCLLFRQSCAQSWKLYDRQPYLTQCMVVLPSNNSQTCKHFIWSHVTSCTKLVRNQKTFWCWILHKDDIVAHSPIKEAPWTFLLYSEIWDSKSTSKQHTLFRDCMQVSNTLGLWELRRKNSQVCFDI